MDIKNRKGREYIILNEEGYDGMEALVLKKVERQLVVYKYLASGKILKRDNVLHLYGIPSSTIYKDMQDLTEAGLINLKFEAKYDSYEEIQVEIHSDNKQYKSGKYKDTDQNESEKSENTEESQNQCDTPNHIAHIKKLRRLAWCMRHLYNDPPVLDWDEEERPFIKLGKSCKDYYMEQFPEESSRTMNRDFETLTNIGYVIRFNKELKRYDFFDDSCEWSDYPWIPGIIYVKEYGLCHLTGSDYEMEIHDNLYAETIGIKNGLPEEEW